MNFPSYFLLATWQKKCNQCGLIISYKKKGGLIIDLFYEINRTIIK